MEEGIRRKKALIAGIQTATVFQMLLKTDPFGLINLVVIVKVLFYNLDDIFIGITQVFL
jgi:hypothetical protein